MNDKIMIFLVFVLLFVGIGAYWWFMEYTPVVEQIAELDAKIQKLKKEINNVGKLEKEIKEKKELLKKTKEEYALIEKSAITDKDMSIPDLIRIVRTFAKQTKVDFNEIKISKLFSYEYYDELPIEFNFTGPYHNMGRMMARLENLKMINARKGKFSMTPYREVGGGRRRTFGRRSFNLEEDNKNKITMSLAASSFIFKSKGGDFGVQGF